MYTTFDPEYKYTKIEMDLDILYPAIRRVYREYYGANPPEDILNECKAVVDQKSSEVFISIPGSGICTIISFDEFK